MPVCPRCGRELEAYCPDEGGWCRKCREWWPDDIVCENTEEAEG